MNHIPAISVIMTVFNTERYVDGAIQSIRAQSFDDFEFIIVDDGSTDQSPGIIAGHAMKDARIRVISRPNTGIVGALNDGLAAARGEFIARMDADDLCDADRFELQIKRLQTDPELVAVGSCAVAIDPDGRKLGVAPVPLTHEEIDDGHLHGLSCIYHPAVMMRSEAVGRVGGYRDLCPAEDLDLWLRLGEVGQLANLPELLFTWRRTVSGIVASNLGRRQQAVARALNDAWNRRGLQGQAPIPRATFVSRSGLYRQWAWMALNASELATSRLYAAKSLVLEPWCWESWRLAACSVRGY